MEKAVTLGECLFISAFMLWGLACYAIGRWHAEHERAALRKPHEDLERTAIRRKW